MGIGTSKAGQSEGFRLTKLSAIELIVTLALLGLAGMLGYNAFTSFYFNITLEEALVKRGTGFGPEAQKAAKSAYELQENNPDAALLYGQVLYDNGSDTEALTQLQTAMSDTRAGDWLEMAVSLAAVLLSQEALAKTNWEQAEGLLVQVLARDPAYASAHALLGQLRLNQGNYFGDDGAEQHFAQAVSAWRSIASAPKLDYNDASWVPNVVLCAVAYNGLGMCAFQSYRDSGDPAKLLDAMQHFRSALAYRMPWAVPLINLERTGAVYAHYQYTRLRTNATELNTVARTMGSIAQEFGYYEMHLSDKFRRINLENPIMDASDPLIEANRAIARVIMYGFRMRRLAVERPTDYRTKEIELSTTFSQATQLAALDFPDWNRFIALCENFHVAGNSGRRLTDAGELQTASRDVDVSKLRPEEELAFEVNLLISLATRPAGDNDYQKNPLGSAVFKNKLQRIKELLDDPDLPSDAPRPSKAWIRILEYLSMEPGGIQLELATALPTELAQVREQLRRCATVTCFLPAARPGPNELAANDGLLPRDAPRLDSSFTPITTQLTLNEFEGPARAIAMYLNWIDSALGRFPDAESEDYHGLSAKIRIRLYEVFGREPRLSHQALSLGEMDPLFLAAEKWTGNFTH